MSEIRVVHPNERDAGTAQTLGMSREEGCGGSTTGAEGLWVGHVTMEKGVRSGPHHHGPLESAIYIIKGRARLRYGPKLENVVEAQAGDFIFVPPELIHQEINASEDESIDMIVARSGKENIAVNVPLPEGAEEV